MPIIGKDTILSPVQLRGCDFVSRWSREQIDDSILREKARKVIQNGSCRREVLTASWVVLDAVRRARYVATSTAESDGA